jgi:hypothetical protein
MRMTAGESLRQVVGAVRRVEELRIVVEFRNVKRQHRLRGILRVDDVLVVPVFHDELLVGIRAEQGIEKTPSCFPAPAFTSFPCFLT